MAEKLKRLRIGLIFSYNENWIAGTYYILNIIHSLKYVAPERKPVIVLLSSGKDFEDLKKETGYPYLEHQDLELLTEGPAWVSRLNRFYNRIHWKLFGRDGYLFYKRGLDLIYPNPKKSIYLSKCKSAFWIPDFQERYLTGLYPEEELKKRIISKTRWASDSCPIVFSSRNAESDFHKFYPDSPAPSFVLRFAVTLPDSANVNMDAIRKKYTLPEKFFFSPNQLYRHKNHMILLQALNILKVRHPDIFVAVSGKNFDVRNPEYGESLKDYIRVNSLEDHVAFMGFIDREELSACILKSVSVIQPSLFEGWSTVIEDSKSLNSFVLASDIPVHREQISENVRFFDPHDPEALARLMEEAWTDRPVPVPVDYTAEIAAFGNQFMDFAEKVTA